MIHVKDRHITIITSYYYYIFYTLWQHIAVLIIDFERIAALMT